MNIPSKEHRPAQAPIRRIEVACDPTAVRQIALLQSLRFTTTDGTNWVYLVRHGDRIPPHTLREILNRAGLHGYDRPPDAAPRQGLQLPEPANPKLGVTRDINGQRIMDHRL